MNTIIDQMIGNIKKITPKWPIAIATQIYVFCMLVIFPLFYTDKMFHLYLDKRNFFLIFSIIYLCVIFPIFLIDLYNWGNDIRTPKRMNTIFILILLSALIVSTIFALNARNSFFEMSSRTISGLCLLVCIFIFLAVRKYGKADQYLLLMWAAGSSALYIFGILCACGVNVFHIQDGLLPKQIPSYLTPLSNTNYNTCYVCLMLPPIMVMYMICKKESIRILCGINLYLGFLFTLFIKTDSSIIAIILGIIALGYFALENNRWSMRYIQLTGIYLGSKFTIRILLYLFAEKLHSFHGLGLLLLNNKLLLCEILCYLAFFLIWKRNPDNVIKSLADTRKLLAITSIILICCCTGCILYANINAANLSDESLWRHLVLTDSTFNRRGYIWLRTVSVLKQESIGRKLFGNGLNSFKTLMRITRTLPSGNTFADPHNEFLQMATDMGILGLIGYFGLLFSSFIRGLQNWRKNSFYIIAVLTLTVYLIQGLINGYSIYTLPLLFIFLGLINMQSLPSQ